jgi:hypothetical protein
MRQWESLINAPVILTATQNAYYSAEGMIGSCAYWREVGEVVQTAGYAHDGYVHKDLTLHWSQRATPLGPFNVSWLDWLYRNTVGFVTSWGMSTFGLKAQAQFPGMSSQMVSIYARVYGGEWEGATLPIRDTADHSVTPILVNGAGGQTWFSIPASIISLMEIQASTTALPDAKRRLVKRSMLQKLKDEKIFLSEEQKDALLERVLCDPSPKFSPRNSRIVAVTLTIAVLAAVVMRTGYSLNNRVADFKEYPREIRVLSDVIPRLERHPTAYSSNYLNEQDALRRRVLIAPEAEETAPHMWWELIDETYGTLFPRPALESPGHVLWLSAVGPVDHGRWPTIHPMSDEAYLASFKGAKKAEVERAMDQYLGVDPEAVATVYSAFIKSELLPHVDVDKLTLKAPRLIQAPKMVHRIATGKWVKAAGKWLQHTWNMYTPITYGSGYNSLELGQWIKESLAMFGEPHFIEVDFHRWDACVSSTALAVQRAIFEKLGCPRKILNLMERQDCPFVRTKRGWTYTLQGTRKSGEPETSMGNSLLNGLLHRHIFTSLFGRGGYKVIIMGDDMLASVDPAVWDRWDSNVYTAFVNSLGLTPEIKVHDTWRKASFCSSYFWPCELTRNYSSSYGTWQAGEQAFVMFPKTGRLLSKFGYAIGEPTRVDEQRLKGIGLGHMPHGLVVPGVVTYLMLASHCTEKEAVEPEWTLPAMVEDPLQHLDLLRRTEETDTSALELYGADAAAIDSWAVTDRQGFVEHATACEA